MITRRSLLVMAVPAAFAVAAVASAGPAVAHETGWPTGRSQAVRITDQALAMPAVVSGPVIDLTIRNDGSIARELAVAQILAGTTLGQVLGVIGVTEPEPAFVLGDPGGVFLLGPGERVRYQRRLAPGSYVFFVPTGNGTPQLSAAAYQIVRVTSGGRRELPEAERAIRLGDDGITVPKLTAGAHRYAITNTGIAPHEVFIVGVRDPADLAKADEVGAWLEAGQVGPPPVPVHFPGSHQTIEHGVTVVLTLDFHRTTTYAFVDFQTGATTTGTTR